MKTAEQLIDHWRAEAVQAELLANDAALKSYRELAKLLRAKARNLRDCANDLEFSLAYHGDPTPNKRKTV